MLPTNTTTKADNPTPAQQNSEMLFCGKAWKTAKQGNLIVSLNSKQIEEIVKKHPDKKFINAYDEMKFYVGEKKEVGKAKETHYVTLMEFDEKK